MMTSSRPYLLRALYEWIVDNGLTPHILVNAMYPGTDVPRASVQDGRIVLNLSSQAVQSLEITNEWLSFRARFSGQSMDVMVPADAVMAIYARENGEGMVFPEQTGTAEPAPPTDNERPRPGKPGLKVVK